MTNDEPRGEGPQSDGQEKENTMPEVIPITEQMSGKAG